MEFKFRPVIVFSISSLLVGASCKALLILKANLEPLVVNISNKGGDILRETFEANLTEDTMELSFRQYDGTFINHLIDFRTTMQAFHVLLLPDRTVRQTDKQEFCFLIPFGNDEYISADAITKLRQKNPHTIRQPEEERETQYFHMTMTPDSVTTSHAFPLCKKPDIRTFLPVSEELLTDNSTVPSAFANTPVCDISLKTAGQSCICTFKLCIVWYPCGLKFCQAQQPNGEIIQYRCGIKTCRKCRHFQFIVKGRSECPAEFYV